MNTFSAIDVSYIRPSRTIETVLLENNKEKKIIYVYNYEGVHFRVFVFLENLVKFLDIHAECDYSFNTEEELDVFLSQCNLLKLSSKN